MKVAILGASEKEGRYARMAQERLSEAGHEVFPVTPRGGSVLGVPAVRALGDLPPGVDTLTVYVGSRHMMGHLPALRAAGFRRVIFNPGTECETTMEALAADGVEVIRGCTLVMLGTGQF